MVLDVSLLEIHDRGIDITSKQMVIKVVNINPILSLLVLY